MKRFGLVTLLMAGTAITPAAAQELTGNCSALLAMYEGAGDRLSDDFQDAGEVARANDDAQCVVYVERIADAGTILRDGEQMEGEAVETARDTFLESETITQQVEISTQAVVEGDVLVRVPQPDVAVDQAGAEIAVTDAPASVTIDQTAPEIIIRQAEPRITVAMPTPTITIEQAAPEIIITMPRPGVSVEDAEPTVEVVMAEPVIRVTQAEPQLDVNVEARFLAEGEEVDPEGEYIRSETQIVDAQGNATDSDVVENFQLTQGESTVIMERPDATGEQVTFNAAQPVVRFEAAEPVIEFTMDGEPTVQFQQIGEVRVTLRESGAEGMDDMEEQDRADADMTGDGDEQMQAADAAALSEQDGEMETADATAADADMSEMETAGAATMTGDESDGTAMLARSADADAMQTGTREVMASDLSGMPVENLQGESLGEFDRVVDNGGRMFGIIEHGGFLGFGETAVALPLDRLILEEDRILLQGLTEAELDALPEYDSNRDLEVDGQTRLQLMETRG